MHLDYYSTRELQVTFKRTKLVKPYFYGPTYDTGFYFLAGRRHIFVTVHLIGHMQMRHRSYEIPPLVSKVYHHCDTLLIFRGTLNKLRDT